MAKHKAPSFKFQINSNNQNSKIQTNPKTGETLIPNSVKFILILILACSPLCALAQDVDVPLDYWGYSFLANASTRGIFCSNELATLPISRGRFARLIENIENRLSITPDIFSAEEKKLFEVLKRDFSSELKSLLKQSPLSNERHVLSFDESDRLVYFDLYGDQSFTSNTNFGQSQKMLSKTTAGGIIRGHLGHMVNFYIDAQNAASRGTGLKRESDLNFDPTRGLPVNITGNTVFQDRALAYFTVAKFGIRMEAGQNEIAFGPYARNGLTVSRGLFPANMVKLETEVKNLRLTSAHLFLRCTTSKYLAFHKADFRVNGHYSLGFSEAVVYGRRDIDPRYLNPLIPYYLLAPSQLKKDSYSLNFRHDVTIPPIQFYNEFYLGNNFLNTNMAHAFRDYFAYLIGAHWVTPLHLANMEIFAEFVRVENNVYTHPDSIKFYTHYNQYIGYPFGPGTTAMSLRMGYQFTRDVRFEFDWQRVDKNTASLFSVDRDLYGDEQPDFYATPVHYYEIKSQFRLLHDVYLILLYSYLDHQLGGQTIDDGVYKHTVNLSLRLNY
jgi:hypothetical protein